MSIKYDTFTETSTTPLESHTSDIGSGWDTNVTADFDVTRFRVNATSDELELEVDSYFRVLGAESLSSADCFAEVTGKTGGATSIYAFRAIIRGDGVARNWIEGGIRGDGAWHVARTLGGSITTLANGTISGFSASQYYKIKIVAIGDNIRFYIDDVETSNINNSDVSASGAVGLMMQGLLSKITLFDSSYVPSNTGISPSMYESDMFNMRGAM